MSEESKLVNVGKAETKPSDAIRGVYVFSTTCVDGKSSLYSVKKNRRPKKKRSPLMTFIKNGILIDTDFRGTI